jgi:hypothetical protein
MAMSFASEPEQLNPLSVLRHDQAVADDLDPVGAARIGDELLGFGIGKVAVVDLAGANGGHVVVVTVNRDTLRIDTGFVSGKRVRAHRGTDGGDLAGGAGGLRAATSRGRGGAQRTHSRGDRQHPATSTIGMGATDPVVHG